MGDRAVEGEMLEVHRSEHAKVWLCSDLPNWAVTQVSGHRGPAIEPRSLGMAKAQITGLFGYYKIRT